MSLPLTADLEGAAGFRSVKDESSKEPALVVRRGLCCRYVACVALALAAAAGAIWQSDAALKALAPELAARRAKFRLSAFRRKYSPISRHVATEGRGGSRRAPRPVEGSRRRRGSEPASSCRRRRAASD